MLEQYDEHRLGNSVAVAARIIYRLSKLVPDNMDRSGLFSFFSKELRASFHYDRFSIFLYDAERDFLTAFTAAGGAAGGGFFRISRIRWLGRPSRRANRWSSKIWPR